MARKRISMKEYNLKMAAIIKIGRPVADTLIALLEEASKYNLKGVKPPKPSVLKKRRK